MTLIAFLAFALAQAAAVAQPPIAGAWKLNMERSTELRLPPGTVNIRQYTLRPDGFLVGLLITAPGPQGPFHTLQFTAKSDGKDYPEYADTNISDMIAAGTPTIRTYSETKDDEYTTDWTDKLEGRVTAHGKKTVSKDGKTLTITVDGFPVIYVYDRQ